MKAKIEKLMVFLIPTDQVVGDFSQSMIKSDKLLAEKRQGNLFEDPRMHKKSQALMEAMDKINRTLGHGSIKLMAEGNDPRWAMRSEHCTPRYTTRLDELPVAQTR